MKNIILFLLMLSASSITVAETIDTAMYVNGTYRKLLIAKPDNFNNSTAVICLHYCGGSANEYREAMADFADSTGAVIACPDYSSSKVPAEDTMVFQTVVDSLQALFTIDTTDVYLTGMSCNADYILRNAMGNRYPFKGIFPWAPYSGSANPNNFTFRNQANTVIAIGTKDSKLRNVLTIYDSIQANDSKVELILVEDVGHTLQFDSFTETMLDCFDYLNSSSQVALEPIADISVVTDTSITVPISITDPDTEVATLRINTSAPASYSAIDVAKADNGFTIDFHTSKKIAKTVAVIEALSANGTVLAQTTAKITVVNRPKPTEPEETQQTNGTLQGEESTSVSTNSPVDFYLSPNPSTGAVRLCNLIIGSTITITTHTGTSCGSFIAKNQIEILDTNLPSGQYYITVTAENVSVTQVLVVK